MATMKRSSGNWLITGASSGFGREMARAVLQRGGQVIATARRPEVLQDLVAESPECCMAVALDVANAAQIKSALAVAESRFGAIDVLVNNAGYGLLGSIEESDEADIRRLFEVNFFGLVAVTRALMPSMRARRTGWIINLSSVAGQIGMATSGFYSASKFAIEGFSESLRSELAALGVGVTVVEPGLFRTRFLDNLQVRDVRLADYEATVGQQIEYFRKLQGREPGDPVRAAAAIVDALDHDPPPRQLVLGEGAIDRISQKLAQQLEAMSQWRAVAVSADYPK
jgi:NADP-dependent 3-hydroxy acid dehydrogenase YdfG